jgi:hypothetical protein
VTGVGLVWTLLLTNVAVRCTIENATSGSGCDAGDIGIWILGAAGILGLGAVGTVVAARRARAR